MASEVAHALAAVPLSPGADIQRLRERIEAEDYASGPGRAARMDIGPEYQHRVVSDCRLARPMKIVVDSGNGIPGASAPGILRALGWPPEQIAVQWRRIDVAVFRALPRTPENCHLVIEAKRLGAAEFRMLGGAGSLVPSAHIPAVKFNLGKALTGDAFLVGGALLFRQHSRLGG